MFFKRFESTGKIKMGRKLLRSFDGPCLCSSFTFASFHFSGKVLVLILKLHIYIKLSAMKGATNFKSLGPIHHGNLSV